MKILRLITLSLLVSFFVACNSNNNKQEVVNNDALLNATLYQQVAAEYTALCYQAYQVAALRLDQALKNNMAVKPLAIVVDVDETVLDNSPFEARSILENSDYPTHWAAWCEQATAAAVPGAVEFLNDAASKGVETYYITNRKIEFKEVSIKNLKERGFPNVDEKHVLMRTSESNKEMRRQKVLETHEIVLLIGDNLSDFSALFEGNSQAERLSNVNVLKSEFGKRFIVLPNAMYGAWLDALFTQEGSTKEEKLAMMKKALITF